MLNPIHSRNEETRKKEQINNNNRLNIGSVSENQRINYTIMNYCCEANIVKQQMPTYHILCRLFQRKLKSNKWNYTKEMIRPQQKNAEEESGKTKGVHLNLNLNGIFRLSKNWMWPANNIIWNLYPKQVHLLDVSEIWPRQPTRWIEWSKYDSEPCYMVMEKAKRKRWIELMV